ncbi:Rft-1-domain-containing protein [Calocera viscosa TUFC12733]|uniref:Man(5)GlcNAc(2)-PP-dolichol translocation protein RFT1 n=1 Tax=Calocera viscosa (strain TUFC12733) TaxID=1330018 RepID=A0A167NDA7_CALVF|nr:Rft-1-domain-containing protein [Calocera viscosa TUFC12733]
MSNAHRPRNDNLARASLLSASLATASSLVVLQLLSRLVTFVLNQALVRLAPPEVFGTASVQFDLLLATILFLSREGVRNALLRANEGQAGPSHSAGAQQRKSDQVSNIALLPVYLGFPLSILTSALYQLTSTRETRSQPHFALSVWLYALGAFLVLLAEPLHIRAVNELRMGVRVRAEGAGVVVNSIATFLVMLLGGAGWALVAFAVGKVVYGVTLCAVYLWEYRVPLSFPLIPPANLSRAVVRYFDKHLLRLSLAMSGQGVVKHFLTEGDSLILARISSLKDQGGYAVANNYGSLIARIVFLPLEETSRLFFSKTLSSPDPSSGAVQTPESLQSASDVLSTLLLLYSHLALFFLSLGPPLVPTLLAFLLPSRYLLTSAPLVLRAYCLYLPIMAFNGLLEAFFASTAEQADLTRQARTMLLFSLLFLLSALGFVRGMGWGEVGLVYANSVNLLLRAGYCYAYVRRYFSARGQPQLASLRAASPPWAVWATFAAAAAVVRASEANLPLEPTLKGRLVHLAVGAACGLVCLAVCTGTQRQAVGSVVSIVRKKKE